MVGLSDKIGYYDDDHCPKIKYKDLKEAIKKETEEIQKLKDIVNGDSPDTFKLESFKGLIKNQIEILERRRIDAIFGEELVE